MLNESIVVACDGGIPVVLAATRRAAGLLERLAEDLIVAGAELEIVTDIDRAPARLAETIDRLDRPAVIALCHTAEDIELGPARAMIAACPGDHHDLECELGDDRSPAALRPVLAAMRELVRGSSDDALGVLFEEVRQRGEPITDSFVPPPPPVEAIAPRKRAPGKRHAWAWGTIAGAVTSAMVVALVLLADRRAALPAGGTDDAFATTHPRTDTRPAPAATRSSSAPRVRPAPQPTPNAVELPPQRMPELHVAAQGPAAEAEAPAPAPEDELALAIRRGRALELDGLVVHLVTGERDWFGAMNTCRARGFWGTGGWRVPTVNELRAIARTRAFADRPAWSNRRGGRDASTAVAISLVGGAHTTFDKRSRDAVTICVKDRG